MIREKIEQMTKYQDLLSDQLVVFNDYLAEEDNRIRAAVFFALRWIQNDFASEITISTKHMMAIADKTLWDIKHDKLDDYGGYKKITKWQKNYVACDLTDQDLETNKEESNE